MCVRCGAKRGLSSLYLDDAKVYEPLIRAPLGTALKYEPVLEHFCKIAALKSLPLAGRGVCVRCFSRRGPDARGAPSNAALVPRKVHSDFDSNNLFMKFTTQNDHD